MELASFIDIAIGAVTLLGSLASAGAAVWLFFRKKLRRWWAPYRAGFEGMSEVPALRSDVADVRKSIGMLAMQVRARGDVNIEQAEFEADATGANTYANLTYARWLGVGKAELLGWNWVNFLHPEDRLAVRREWDSCREEHRVYSMRYRMIDADGEEFTVDAIATPIPEAPPAKQWLGVIRRVVT
ncbi:MAG: PAS domain-containing protein [Lysobacter sp.]